MWATLVYPDYHWTTREDTNITLTKDLLVILRIMVLSHQPFLKYSIPGHFEYATIFPADIDYNAQTRSWYLPPPRLADISMMYNDGIRCMRNSNGISGNTGFERDIASQNANEIQTFLHFQIDTE